MIVTDADGARKMPALGAQLGADLGEFGAEISDKFAERDERLARMWRVHQKVTRAEHKYGAGRGGGAAPRTDPRLVLRYKTVQM